MERSCDIRISVLTSVISDISCDISKINQIINRREQEQEIEI